MTDETPSVAIYHQGRRIVATGRAVVTYGAPPLVVSVGRDVLMVPLHLYVPLTRQDGSIVGERPAGVCVAPGAPFVSEVSGCTVSVELRPVDPAERTVIVPSFAGRIGPTSWHLTWEVWQAAPGMAVPAAPEPEWRLPEAPVRDWTPPNPWETPASLHQPFTGT